MKLHRRKFMLRVRWDHCSITYFEFLNCSSSLSVNLFSKAVKCAWKRTALVNRRNVVLLYDNAKPHSARITEKFRFSLVCSTPYTILYQSDFPSQKMVRINRHFLKNQPNFNRKELRSKLINGKKWLKIIANMLLIEINSLLNYSWIDYILLKRKLFMIQPSIYIYIYVRIDRNIHRHGNMLFN